jgi:hypothetical protein
VPTRWSTEELYTGRSDDLGYPVYTRTECASINCPTCEEFVTFPARQDERQSGEEVGTDGRTVSEVFRFVSGRGRYTTSCRACERTARQRAAAAVAGSERLFGVEIECNVPEGCSYSDVHRAIVDAGVPCMDEDGYGGDYDEYGEPMGTAVDAWCVKGDGSLGYQGVEVCSPPIRGSEGLEQVRRVCRALTGLGCSVDTRCGLHVHHDVRGARTTIGAVKRFVRTWYENQPLIDGLVSRSRRSSNDAYYCRGLTPRDMRRIEGIDSLEELGGVDRYRTVNVTSYPVHGTIEVRQHQGTLDSEKITSWVKLGQAMLDDAEARQAARPRAASVEDMLDRMGDRLDDTAKTYLIGRAVQLGAAPVSANLSVLA